MPTPSQGGMFEPAIPGEGDLDNVTDWCLNQFRRAYGDDGITKDDIWEYFYGVMHAPDWRETYKHDLQRNLPRIPFAADFEAFRTAGRELMDLHTGYESCPEADVRVRFVDPASRNSGGGGALAETSLFAEIEGGERGANSGECDSNSGERGSGVADAGDTPGDAYRITGSRMRLRRNEETGTAVLEVNDGCRLEGIPPEALAYKVSGRSPLEWAVDSLRRKADWPVPDDPNQWHVWAEDSYQLIRHLRRLIHVGIRSDEIIRSLPPSLEGRLAMPADASAWASGGAPSQGTGVQDDTRLPRGLDPSETPASGAREQA